MTEIEMITFVSIADFTTLYQCLFKLLTIIVMQFTYGQTGLGRKAVDRVRPEFAGPFRKSKTSAGTGPVALTAASRAGVAAVRGKRLPNAATGFPASNDLYALRRQKENN